MTRHQRAPVPGAVAAIDVVVGETVQAGQTLMRLESMKMEVPLQADCSGVVRHVAASLGETVQAGDLLLEIEPVASGAELAPGPAFAAHSAAGQAALQQLQARRELLFDRARPEAVAARHAGGRSMVRECIEALLEPDSFVEYGGFAVAAQRSRRDEADLRRNTPADGLVTGSGLLAGSSQTVAVMGYDYTVLAGTQGVFNHRKSDRLLELAERQRWPLVLLAEGGGGRPGDVDWLGVAGLDCTTFARLARLSGQVPSIGVVGGRCFAGNAALLGCCDLIVGVEGASLGMGGPAMIEGGGLGRVEADAVGPVPVLAQAGVIDVRVGSDLSAMQATSRLLGLALQPKVAAAQAGGSQETLRSIVPERRQATYDPRQVIETVADAGSPIELRREFGPSVITTLARIGGQAVAIAASDPRHLGGALDAPACDKLARFMQLADCWGLPLVTLVDTPGFMVGPASEQTGMIRHAARVFVAAAVLRVPVASVVLRRGYGLGAMALTAGHFHAPVATCAWPQGEFGAMGIEGAVKLGFRKELAAAPEAEREALFQRLVAQALERGQALNMASHLEIDDVIDPADTRDWLQRVLRSAMAQPLAPRRPFLDPW